MALRLTKRKHNPLAKVVRVLSAIILLFGISILLLLQLKIREIVDHSNNDALGTPRRVPSESTTVITNTDTEQILPGWKTIDVFFGNSENGHLQSRGKSQCKQDELVSALLKDKPKGFFVDMAANAAVNLSNTYQLEQKLDWTGICIEPNPRYWSGLAHRKCHVAAVAVGKKRMEEVQFRMYNDLWRRAASGGIEEFIDPNIPKGEDKSTPLYTVPAGEVLERYHSPSVMDYLSLDIEGAEYMVMKHFPFNKYRFRVMTVERPSQDMVDLLYDNGYLYIGGNNEDGEETAWAHKDFMKNEDFDLSGVEKVGWIGGKSTKWMTLNETNPMGKPTVNDWRIKKKRN